jgi:hypothetical protein
VRQSLAGVGSVAKPANASEKRGTWAVSARGY